MSVETIEATCPECGGTDIVTVPEELVRVTYRALLYSSGSGGVACPEDGEETDREIVETCRDEQVWRCEDCGEERDDPEDFVPVEDDDEEELSCHACAGELMLMGTLGQRQWYRCRRCGLDHGEAGG